MYTCQKVLAEGFAGVLCPWGDSVELFKHILKCPPDCPRCTCNSLAQTRWYSAGFSNSFTSSHAFFCGPSCLLGVLKWPLSLGSGKKSFHWVKVFSISVKFEASDTKLWSSNILSSEFDFNVRNCKTANAKLKQLDGITSKQAPQCRLAA